MDADVLFRIRKCVAEVLALNIEEVQADSKLMEDLGAESLDLVELMYLIESEFNIVVRQEDLSLSAQLGIPEEEIHQDEVLTVKALKLLLDRFPHAESLLVEGTKRSQLAALLTVEEIAKSIQRKLNK